MENFNTIFDTSSFEIDWPLPIEKNKKVTGRMKDKFVGLRVKA